MQFEWDEGNQVKVEKIRISGWDFAVDETESAFADPKRLIETSYSDGKTGELRYKVTGLSNQNRVISVIFVVRDGQIRIFNVWKAKQTTLKKYYAQTTDTGGEETARGETDTGSKGD